MRYTPFVCLALLIGSLHAATITPDFLRHVFDTLTVDVRSVDQIRPEILSELGYLAHDQHLKLANSGERFNATDVIDTRFPNRGICFAARSSDEKYVLICYDRGGYTSIQCAVLFLSLDPKRPDLTRAIWAATIPYAHRCKSLADLRTAIEQDNVVPYAIPFDVF